MKRSWNKRTYKDSPEGISNDEIFGVNENEGKKEFVDSADKIKDYIQDLGTERSALDPNELPLAARLVEQEISKVQGIGRIPPREYKYVNIYREKPIKITSKVVVPILEHPRFNFVGKLLGPKGNSLKRLQEETMCKMSILGKGSMKDPQKEEELKTSGDPRYAHLSEDLYVEISSFGPPAEAYAHMAFALAEIRKYLIPDKNDSIRQEQLRELGSISGTNSNGPRSSYRRDPSLNENFTRDTPPRPPPLMRTATRGPVITSRVMPAKVKIMSILDRARLAMQDSYSFEEPFTTPYHADELPSSPVHTFGEADHHPITGYYRNISPPRHGNHFHRGKSSSQATPQRHTESSRYRLTSYARTSMKAPY